MQNMDILEQLKTDHANVSRLLDILEEQLHRVQRLESADFDLMRDIMHYMTKYPDSVHHPTEDLIIEKIVERDPSSRAAALSVVREHADLARKSAAFLDMLHKVIDGEIVLRTDIAARGVDYIDFLRSHMTREEAELFPLAEKSLCEDDWQRIAETIEHRTDPIFGSIVEAQYKTIYEFIHRQSEL